MSQANRDNLLMAFVGDDFTGSTDAMESLARHGLRTLLFTETPSSDQFKKYPGLKAFGVAGLTRSLPTDRIAAQIRPIFSALRDFAAPIVHYKTCSTFDSSPAIGNIGRVIDVGSEVFASQLIPVLVGAPALGRYCVFGNLFARCGSDPELHRLDRHPSMSRHPITPMDEADLRRHLAKQTSKPISLLDVLALESPPKKLDAENILLIDVLYERHLQTIGSLLAARANPDHPLFVVGSSGVESALCAHWTQTGIASATATFPPPKPAGPIIAVCGSCSPVTGSQIKWATTHGFAEVVVNASETSDAIARSTAAIRKGQSVCIHTAGTQSTHKNSPNFGPILGNIVAETLKQTPVRRIAVAGGDTASQIARILQIEAVEMIAELTRGSPLCKATSANPIVDGLEITFKGGQIGAEDFFGLVQHGSNFHQEKP